MKKTFIILILLAVPLLSIAQNDDRAQSIMYDAGSHLKRASSFYLGGTALEVLGGGIIALTAANKPKNTYTNTPDNSGTYVGVAVAGVGLILQIVGFIQVGKAGKSLRNDNISLDGNGVSFNF